MIVLFGAIGEKWNALGGPQSFLGEPFHQEAPTADGVGRFVRFPGGAIYWHPDIGAHEIHGAIFERWEALSHERSFLGYPITDEMDAPEGGRLSVFERGVIYWWPDVGPVDMGEMFMHYTGLNCFAETAEPTSASDEPYAVIGVTVPGQQEARPPFLTSVHGDVDAGESRPEMIELYRGLPRGIAIVYQVMENDHGRPEQYRDAMRGVVGAASSAASTLVTLIPKVGPVLGAAAGPILGVLGPTIADKLGTLLGLGDDTIGNGTIILSVKDMVKMALAPQAVERNVGFKIASPLLTGDGGAYKVYFGGVKTP